MRSSDDVRLRLWVQGASFLVPLLWLTAALVVGFVSPALDRLVNVDTGISQDAARDMLTATGTGMIAFTGLVFSLGLLIVQFSSQSLSPRVIPELRRDRFVGHALGVFVATFVFCLGAVLDIGKGKDVAPTVTCAIAFLLLVASVVMFLGLLQRITSALQIPLVLARLGSRGREAIESVYPERYRNQGDDADVESEPVRRPLPDDGWTLTHHEHPAVVATVALDELRVLAAKHHAVIEVVPAIGQRVATGDPLVRVAAAGPEPGHRDLRHAIVLAPARTIEQDPAYAVRLIVDIAIKALSPAINDPTTATQALDELQDILILLGGRAVTHGDDSVRIHTTTWPDFVALALDEISQYGARSIQVSRRMRALLDDVEDAVPVARRGPLAMQRDRLDAELADTFPHPYLRAAAATSDPMGLGRSRQPN